MMANDSTLKAPPTTAEAMVSITDRRSGQTTDLPVSEGAILARDLLRVKVNGEGLTTYDPGFINTCSCRSAITFIDGGKGILEYRGYPIEQVAERISYLETAQLLLDGNLPTPAAKAQFEQDISYHMTVPNNLVGLINSFDRTAHPMSILMAAVAALGTHYPEAKDVRDSATRRQQIIRLIAKLPTLGAMIYRHSQGLDPVLPDSNAPYTANFLQMMFRQESSYQPDPVLVKAMDILFILHADHEQNCSTNAVRGVGSSLADPYTALAAGIGALSGSSHGGANEAVLVMLNDIGSLGKVPAFIDAVKNGDGRLMGFGHRVYKNYDPRARLIKGLAEQVFAVTQPHPLLPIAKELERIALEDDYFVSRKLYPNVDFYSGLIYQAMGFPVEFFTVLFAIGRTSGWCAQWDEMMGDPDMRIARPKQIFIGPARRDVPGAR